jgi:hypothetical protein
LDYVNGAGADYSYAAAGRLLYVDNSTNNGQHKSRPELAEEGNRGQVFIIHCPAQAVPATGESEKRKRRFRGVTGAPCPSGRTAVSDPSVQRASKIPGRPCVGGNPGRTAHQRTKNISIRHGSRFAPKRWKRWRVPAATRQREPRDEAHVGYRLRRQGRIKSRPQALRLCPALPGVFRARRASLRSSARTEPTGPKPTHPQKRRARLAFPLNRLFSFGGEWGAWGHGFIVHYWH